VKRTEYCGKVDRRFLAQTVTLMGWVHRRRDHGGVIFVDLRDREGLTQVVFNPETSAELHERAAQLRSEWVLGVRGTVRPRPEGTVNPKLPTGAIAASAGAVTMMPEPSTVKRCPWATALGTEDTTGLVPRYR